MITGDFHHTAIAVARDVGMLAPESPVVVIDAGQPSPDAAVVPSASQANTSTNPSSDQHQAAMQHQQQQQQESRVEVSPSGMSAVQPSENSREQLLPKGTESAQSVQQSVGSSDRLMGSLVQAIGNALQPMGSLQSSMGSASPLLGPLQPMHSQPSAISASAISASAVRLNSERLRSSDLGSQSMKRVHYQQSAEAERLKPALSGTVSNPNLASGQVQTAPTKRLRFTIGDMGREQDPTEALTAMAQGQMRCAVTGEAFELLLQLPDESALYAVMQNVVVFARMKPHQKGQVMDLLGLRGLHQRCHGRQRHLPVSNYRKDTLAVARAANSKLSNNYACLVQFYSLNAGRSNGRKRLCCLPRVTCFMLRVLEPIVMHYGKVCCRLLVGSICAVCLVKHAARGLSPSVLF